MKDLSPYKDEIPVIQASGNGSVRKITMTQAEALLYFSEKLDVICDVSGR